MFIKRELRKLRAESKLTQKDKVIAGIVDKRRPIYKYCLNLLGMVNKVFILFIVSVNCGLGSLQINSTSLAFQSRFLI